jgi:hypothetical protein
MKILDRLPPEKQAHSFTPGWCTDKNCGLHLIAKDAEGHPICEIVMSPMQTVALMEQCKSYLYKKAALGGD